MFIRVYVIQLQEMDRSQFKRWTAEFNYEKPYNKKENTSKEKMNSDSR